MAAPRPVYHHVQATEADTRCIDGTRPPAREHQGVAAALHYIPTGVLLLERHGHVIHLNPAAEAITTARDGLAIVGGLVRASSMGDGPRLRRLIALVCRGEPAAMPLLQIGRESCRPPYCVAAWPLASAKDADLAETAAAVLMISDPAAALPSLGPTLRTCYGLTATETRVTLRLLEGARVEAIASELGVSLNTVRTHLKRTFSKVGVASQGDLVRVLLAGPGRIVPAQSDLSMKLPAS